eukprot:COSAG01_NODE_46633_length_398_cov_0.963211_1_plen_25_part_10
MRGVVHTYATNTFGLAYIRASGLLV